MVSVIPLFRVFSRILFVCRVSVLLLLLVICLGSSRLIFCGWWRIVLSDIVWVEQLSRLFSYSAWSIRVVIHARNVSLIRSWELVLKWAFIVEVRLSLFICNCRFHVYLVSLLSGKCRLLLFSLLSSAIHVNFVSFVFLLLRYTSNLRRLWNARLCLILVLVPAFANRNDFRVGVIGPAFLLLNVFLWWDWNRRLFSLKLKLFIRQFLVYFSILRELPIKLSVDKNRQLFQIHPFSIVII